MYYLPPFLCVCCVWGVLRSIPSALSLSLSLSVRARACVLCVQLNLNRFPLILSLMSPVTTAKQYTPHPLLLLAFVASKTQHPHSLSLSLSVSLSPRPGWKISFTDRLFLVWTVPKKGRDWNCFLFQNIHPLHNVRVLFLFSSFSILHHTYTQIIHYDYFYFLFMGWMQYGHKLHG